ncbi:hypothetical protein ACOSP7_031916 [Xanthoceras sorbifolium]
MAEFGGHPFYNCRNCKIGDAYTFSYAMNVVLGRREEKQLISGVYTIANIYCSKCSQELGWYYPRAHDLKKDSRKAIL